MLKKCSVTCFFISGFLKSWLLNLYNPLLYISPQRTLFVRFYALKSEFVKQLAAACPPCSYYQTMDFVLKCVGKVIWIKRRFKGKVDPPTRNKAWFAFYVLRAHPRVDLVTAKALIFPDDYNAYNFLLVVLSVWSLLPSSLKMSPDWLIARTLSSAC